LDTEAAYIRSIAQGDRQAFRQVYALYAARIYNIALSYTQSAQDAEEITQDVFLKIHRHAASFKGASAVSTWIYRIAVNTALNALKKKKRNAFLQFGQQPVQQDFEHPGVELEKREKAKILYQVIETLPEKQKMAFILSYIEELPRQEVADIMGISLKAMESLLQRAKKNLRAKLEKLDPNRRIFT